MNKKAKNKNKNKGKKRKQLSQDVTDEPPKKKTKLSDTEELQALFTEPGAAEKKQNLTNTNQFHQSSRSNSRRCSKSRWRDQGHDADDELDEEYNGNVNVTHLASGRPGTQATGLKC